MRIQSNVVAVGIFSRRITRLAGVTVGSLPVKSSSAVQNGQSKLTWPDFGLGENMRALLRLLLTAALACSSLSAFADNQNSATTTQTQPSEADLTTHKHYVNHAGETVHSPSKTVSGQAPVGATAQCGDGTYSFSRNHRGTCSHHGGVAH